MRRCCRRRERRRPRPYGVRELRLLGVLSLSAGLLLLFLCVPGWAWTALAGAALTAAGLWLATLGVW